MTARFGSPVALVYLDTLGLLEPGSAHLRALQWPIEQVRADRELTRHLAAVLHAALPGQELQQVRAHLAPLLSQLNERRVGKEQLLSPEDRLLGGATFQNEPVPDFLAGPLRAMLATMDPEAIAAFAQSLDLDHLRRISLVGSVHRTALQAAHEARWLTNTYRMISPTWLMGKGYVVREVTTKSGDIRILAGTGSAHLHTEYEPVDFANRVLPRHQRDSAGRMLVLGIRSLTGLYDTDLLAAARYLQDAYSDQSVAKITKAKTKQLAVLYRRTADFAGCNVTLRDFLLGVTDRLSSEATAKQERQRQRAAKARRELIQAQAQQRHEAEIRRIREETERVLAKSRAHAAAWAQVNAYGAASSARYNAAMSRISNIGSRQFHDYVRSGKSQRYVIVPR